MSLYLKLLKEYVEEVEMAEAKGKVTIGNAYKKKEMVRERLQDMIVNAIESREIDDQQGLDDLVATFDMAIKALKMVPFAVYAKMHSEKASGGRFDM